MCQKVLIEHKVVISIQVMFHCTRSDILNMNNGKLCQCWIIGPHNNRTVLKQKGISLSEFFSQYRHTHTFIYIYKYMYMYIYITRITSDSNQYKHFCFFSSRLKHRQGAGRLNLWPPNPTVTCSYNQSRHLQSQLYVFFMKIN